MAREGENRSAPFGRAVCACGAACVVRAEARTYLRGNGSQGNGLQGQTALGGNGSRGQRARRGLKWGQGDSSGWAEEDLAGAGVAGGGGGVVEVVDAGEEDFRAFDAIGAGGGHGESGVAGKEYLGGVGW